MSTQSDQSSRQRKTLRSRPSQLRQRALILFTLASMILLLFGMSLILVQHVRAANPDVCSSGCTYTTIQSAITAAAPGATITVGAGTYLETLSINKALTLDGPNVGIAGTNGARGSEAIIDAGGSSTPTVTIAATNVTLDGFTIQGSHLEGITGPSGVDGVLIQNNIITHNYNGIFELGGTTLTVSNNLIRNNTAYYGGSSHCFGGSPYCNGIFIGANFTHLTITNNTIDETYTSITTDFLNNFQRAMSIAPTAAGTVTIESNTLINSTTLGNVTGDFASNTDQGGTFAVRLIGAVTNFSVNNNSFVGLFSHAVVVGDTSAYFAADTTNLTIADNTVTQDVSTLFPGQVYSSSDIATFDLNRLSGTNTISGNTVNFFGSYNGVGITSVQAIRLRSGVTTALSIGGNSFNGGNVGGSLTSGLQFDAGTTAPTVTNNLIRNFHNGVADTTGATYTFGSNNCISGNSLDGFNATGGAVNAQHNWWGSPQGPGSGIGFGNPVTASVDASSFLTTPPQAACGGPIASNVQSSVSPLPITIGYSLSATLDTTTTSNVPVSAGYYTLDGAAPQTMTTTSGTFGSSHTVTVTSGSLAGFPTTGTHQLCVFGVDTFGQTGSPSCITLAVIIPAVNTTTTITSSANPSLAHQSVTLTITVVSGMGTPGGNVSLKDGATTLASALTLDGSGKATFTTAALSIGTHPLIANYAGNSSFNASTSATLNQVVNKINTTTMASGTPNPAVQGQNIAFALHVTGADGSIPTGSLSLSDGSTSLGNVNLSGGSASFTDATLSVGTHLITVTYAGDATHNGSSTTTTVMVATTPTVPTGSNNAFVRFVQSSEAFATTDIAIDGAVTFPNVAACTVQTYLPISAGNHTFTIQSPSGGAPVITQTVNLNGGNYYTLAIVGNTAKAISPALIVFQDDTTAATNQAKTRAYHLADTLGPLQVNIGSTVIAANLAFGNATGYTNQAPGTVTYTFQPSGAPAISTSVNLAVNQVYSVFLVCQGQVTTAASPSLPNSLPQTGFGHKQSVSSTRTIILLLIVGALILFGGGIGVTSYVMVQRQRTQRL